MPVTKRQVKNKRNPDGTLSNRSGVVYDVNITYKDGDTFKSYGKRGFPSKTEAQIHDLEMKKRFSDPNRTAMLSYQSKQTMREYLEEWVEAHGKANLRPSTFDSYRSHIKNHINPYIGDVPLRLVTPAMLDKMFQSLFDKGLAQSSVKYAQRILSVAFEGARKYQYIERNPARDILTKFGKNGKTPDPYTIPQVQQLLGHVSGTEWEMLVVLGGLYGLRLGEIIGLRWQNVDLEKGGVLTK